MERNIETLETQVINLIKKGLTTAEIARLVKLSNYHISSIRIKNYLPNANIIKILLNFPEFENYFIKLFNNSKIDDIILELQNHILFKRKKVTKHLIQKLRYFYNLSPKMYENTYTSNSDRIKGYMIRTSKFSAKRRNLEFNITYKDFNLPEYCPLLNIKLTYGAESTGNDFSHASLDRIDNTKGYIKNNVWVISKLANAMKNQANFEQLETFSTNILKYLTLLKNQDARGNITDIFK